MYYSERINFKASLLLAASKHVMSDPRLARRAVWRSEAMASVYHEILLNAALGGIQSLWVASYRSAAAPEGFESEVSRNGRSFPRTGDQIGNHGRQLTYAGHLAQVELVAIEAVAGVALPHADAAAILAAVQDAALFGSEAFEALVVACLIQGQAYYFQQSTQSMDGQDSHAVAVGCLP